MNSSATGSAARTIAITGASGAIGSNLVEPLINSGYRVIVFGRDPQSLSRRFPRVRAADYDNLKADLTGVDWLINLAVRNNTEAAELADFRSTNVDLVQALYEAGSAAGVGAFLQFSTFRADAPSPTDGYGISKREAEDWLSQQTQIPVTILRLPAVVNGGLGGRLARFDGLGIGRGIGILRPQVSMGRLLDAIMEVVSCAPRNAPRAVEVADPKQHDGLYIFSKRALDISFALATIVLGWWLLALVWLVIRLDSKGPGFLAQSRVGRHGRVFTCYKFRTMLEGTRHVATHEASRGAITKVGAPLRRLKLDELPQVINLLRGEMSLVGPRPCLPSQVELVAARERLGVLSILPGITGWAQVNDIDMSDPERLARTDAEYAVRASLLFDLKILLMTLVGRGRADRVVR